MKNTWILSAILATGLLAGCLSAPQSNILEDGNQLETRASQTRTYEVSGGTRSTNTEAILRSVLATLQDLGFMITDADASLGIISATKMDSDTTRVTVTVRAGTEKQVTVRVSARANNQTIRDAAIYREFFILLDKSVFLATAEGTP